MRHARYQFPTLTRPANCWMVCVLTAQVIREQIASQFDRAQAIVDVAAKEKRDLTAEEKTEVDGILGSGTKGTADHKPGTIDNLEKDLARAEKLEARQAQIAEARANQTPIQQANPTAGDTAPERFASVRIPVNARFRVKPLKCYRGPDAERTAFAMGQYLRAVLGRNSQAQQWCREHGVEIRTALAGNDNDRGAVLVPVEMEQAIIDVRAEYGVFRRNAKSVTMASDTKNQPVRKSGATAYWTGDNQEITESEKQWGNVNLVAKKLGALIRYSSELDEDAIISIADDLTQEIAYALSYSEDDAGFNGDGGSSYGGVVGLKNALLAGSIYTAAAANLKFGDLDLADFEGCMGQLPDLKGIQPKWYIHKKGYYNAMVRLLDAAGGNTNVTLAGGVPQLTFLGSPVELTNVLPSSLANQASTILAYYGDLNLGTVLGNRRGISIAISDQRYFELDQLAIKGTERVDIVCHSTGDASNAGAVVALKTPAA